MTSTARRAAVGAGWLYAYRWGGRLLDLVSIAVLARLLSPGEFGLVAIAASVAAIVEGLSDFDVDRALIRIRDEPAGEGAGAPADRGRELYDTAWTLSVLRGLLAASVMAVTALFLSDSRLSAALLVLALSPLVKGFSNPRFVTFERDLVYSRLAALTLGAKVVAFTVTLAVALLTRSYWALVVGILADTLARVVLSYGLRPYRPRVSLARFSDIFAFSGWMSLATVVTTLAMETDKIIVGYFLGDDRTGLYFLTQRIGSQPTRELISPLQRLLFPSFREIAGDRERLRRVVCESINVLGSLSLAAGCGFALVAGEVVPLALGEQWLAIVPLLVILTPFLGLRGTLSMALPCVMALGETRLLFRVSTIYALVHLPVFIAGTAFFGLTGAIAGIVLAGFFYCYLNGWLLGRTLGITWREILVWLRRPLAATVLMVAAVLAAGRLVEGAWLALVVKVAVGAVVFCGSLAVIWHLEGRPPGLERRLLEISRR